MDIETHPSKLGFLIIKESNMAEFDKMTNSLGNGGELSHGLEFVW